MKEVRAAADARRESLIAEGSDHDGANQTNQNHQSYGHDKIMTFPTLTVELEAPLTTDIDDTEDERG